MTPFKQALAKTLEHEGGYTIINGHETYRGIDRVYWPDWGGWDIVDDWKDKLITSEEMNNTLQYEFDEFYRKNFWNRVRGDDVANCSIAVAIELFDTAVNIGIRTAVRFLQTALNMQNYHKTYPDLAIDGLIGSKTIAALARYMDSQPGSRERNETILLNCMNGEQYIHYKNNPNHRQFRGWFMRV